MNTTNTSHALHKALGAVLVAGALTITLPTHAQQVFATPTAAADAFVDSLARSDDEQLKRILGDGFARYVPPQTSEYEDRLKFLETWARGHKIVASGDDKAMLEVGTHGWTLPIPIVKTAVGWRFDIKATPGELRTRRIGRNELAAMQAVLAYTDAQEEFFAANPDGKAVRHFAQRAVSTPGKRDGLYWPASTTNASESPLGPAFAEVRKGETYHGYRYRVLTAQDKDAPGGAKSYLRDGLMTDGHALIAWPERYGDTGVMTFIVSRDGNIYQKNLGPGTDAAARGIKAYNPDSSWEKVAPPK